ncbi:MAG: VWA domain-containing protein [Acidimicrobiia bacterium]|nr:VWA domain-containing protein [Acidimicrobiia bacterium]
MIKSLGSFIGELRAVGLPVSTAEALDAAEALRVIDIADREGVREALAATLIKLPRHRAPFDVAFDVFFGNAAPAEERAEHDDTPPQGAESGVDDLIAQLAGALRSGDTAGLEAAVRRAVSRLSGFQKGRPVGGRYYLYRVMQRLEGIEEALAAGEELSGLDALLDRDDVAALLERLQAEIRREIIERLVADRGPEPVARTLREPLVEDLDLMHATRLELERVEAAVVPLARKLATRLAQRRRRGRHGRLDLRRTIRRSLAHGGALIEPQFRRPRLSKPDLVLLCDVSGSMATFARFTMQLTYAISHQFSQVRAFAFVDAVDEVTGLFGTGTDFAESMARLSSETRVVAGDGHSDYGAVFRDFAEQHGDVVTPQTTVLVTGDARTNYREDGAEVFADIAAQARSVFWLNPEARRFWDTGDSVMRKYACWCDSVDEVRTLRQLERFVEQIALPQHRPSRKLASGVLN